MKAIIDGIEIELSPAEEAEITAAQYEGLNAPPTVSDYVAAMEALYDTKAKERRYDNRLTCALRAGYPGPFQAEGQAFAIWMDNCNALGYQIMDEVLAGQRPVPTVPELIAELPGLEWPV